jgi:hypothetical protein
LVVSACDTTVIVTVLPVTGIAAGAVYSPLLVITPVAVPPPATPFTCHVIARLVEPTENPSNCTVAPSGTDAVAGETRTLTGPITWKVTESLADFGTLTESGLASAVASTVTVPWD